jgi:hypothetical protein
VIGPTLVRLADWYAARRRRQIERAWREVARLQEQTDASAVRPWPWSRNCHDPVTRAERAARRVGA